MKELILYAISVMWTPGPVNTVILNTGIRQGARKVIPFVVGVSTAMSALIILYGLLGKTIELYVESITFYTSIIGSIYMIYLAYKLLKSNINLDESNSFELKFKQGFFMQLLILKELSAHFQLQLFIYQKCIPHGYLYFL